MTDEIDIQTPEVRPAVLTVNDERVDQLADAISSGGEISCGELEIETRNGTLLVESESKLTISLEGVGR